jgi:hypothetical protein
MEWRVLGNIYKNQMQIEDIDDQQKVVLKDIHEICLRIDREIQAGMRGFGAPRPNIENVIGYMAKIVGLYDQLEIKPPKSNRTSRLIGVTTAILTGNHEGYLEDRNGNFPDWYVGL